MISRRSFLRGALSGTIVGGTLGRGVFAAQAPQVLYNGITLGVPWPPSRKYADENPVRPPYLVEPPRVIPIDLGRQLFVDDFLIANTTLERTWHRPAYHTSNPVLTPVTAWEHTRPLPENQQPLNPSAMVFSDGVFYDPRDGLFKMWYMAGYGASTCLAVSTDGIHWERPDWGLVKGTNIVNREARDSSTVWLDLSARDPAERYKMSLWREERLALYQSPDGIRWTKVADSPRLLDRSTFFYNPFRQVWVFSLRATHSEGSISGRYRHYRETPDFGAVADWTRRPPVAWVNADTLDWARPGAESPPELYNLDCVAYESVLLGLFSIWRGEFAGREKINEITTGFSRDGFHWDRPDRGSFLGVSETPGSWNWANVQSAGGCCLVVGDHLYFYVSGRQGVAGTDRPGVCSTGVAMLRRDGFASMDWGLDEWRIRRGSGPAGALTTRVLTFRGAHLFVNADIRGGELKAEVLDESGRVLPGFDAASCVAVRADSTRQAVRWTSSDLASVAGRAVRLRFTLTRGRLYSFWVSRWRSGESGGFTAAGGPAIGCPVDLPVASR